jgi:hypothetical protein
VYWRTGYGAGGRKPKRMKRIKHLAWRNRDRSGERADAGGDLGLWAKQHLTNNCFNLTARNAAFINPLSFYLYEDIHQTS